MKWINRLGNGTQPSAMAKLSLTLSKPVFVGLEPVEGVCTLVCGKTARFTLLTVTLEGVVETVVVVAGDRDQPPTTKKQRRRVVSLTVDPVKGHGERRPLFKLTAGGFQVPKGSHAIPFLFLPTGDDKAVAAGYAATPVLPPSMARVHDPASGASGKVLYYVKAELKDPGWFQSNLQAAQQLAYYPATTTTQHGPDAIATELTFKGKKQMFALAASGRPVRLGLFDRKESPNLRLRLEARFAAGCGLAVGGTPSFDLVVLTAEPARRFQLDNRESLGLGVLVIQHVSTRLVPTYRFKAEGTVQEVAGPPITLDAWTGEHELDLANARPLEIHPDRHECVLPRHVYRGVGVCHGASSTPLFSTENIQVSYLLEVVVKFTGNEADTWMLPAWWRGYSFQAKRVVNVVRDDGLRNEQPGAAPAQDMSDAPPRYEDAAREGSSLEDSLGNPPTFPGIVGDYEPLPWR